MLLRVAIFIVSSLVRVTFAQNLSQHLEVVDKELKELNALAAEIFWNLSTSGNSSLVAEASRIHEIRTVWREHRCKELLNFKATSPYPNAQSTRAIHLLCRGPSYSRQEAREVSKLLTELRTIYQKGRVCIKEWMGIEPELTNFMSTTRDPRVLQRVWTQWRDAVGPPSRQLYTQLVNLMNTAARRAGYSDIGECWREELEIENLEDKVHELYRDLLPIYKELHALVRFRLRQHYGPDMVPFHGPIPAHLLGDMWGQKWNSIVDIVYGDKFEGPTLTELLRSKNYQVKDIVHRAADMYVSLGFPPMTNKFWELSIFVQSNGSCHGTSANMFQHNDFRMLLCANITGEDFHVIHHEMGHIEYFMAYQHLPAIFQDGANSAVHEAIGEAVMMAASTRPHLERLGLISFKSTRKDGDIKHLLEFALNLLPQLPFALVMDKWRWSVFRGEVSPDHYNLAWWTLRTDYQGISPPVQRSELDFDPAGKFHISDNTPYIRYFLASILQVQLFEAMCKGAIYRDSYTSKDIPFPLHKCDLYGSKQSSETLRIMMSQGRTINWNEAVRLATGGEFTAQPLLRFFEPLKFWLKQQIRRHKIPIGWNAIPYQ